ncbi:MAG: polyprenyl synthetase family protein [Planctomycetota bacterium]|nr:polyprenyl synthetase family protein [Planctomycetota bacterium]
MQSLFQAPPETEPVWTAIAEGLERCSRLFERELTSDLPPVARLCRHVERYRGKMLRPTLSLLCGMASAPPPTGEHANPKAWSSLLSQELVTVGTVCELVHMATLVHDDVLDEADTRRRGQTVNRLYGNEAAVILGDYLIASAYHLCSSLRDQSAALVIARTSLSLCAGELLQLHHRNDASLDEATYFEIVARKTGDLIAASCSLGVAQMPSAKQHESALHAFGRLLGVAFQIQDDLLDLTGTEAVVGKSVHKDLEKGKLTLPLIHHLRHAPARERGRTLLLLESASDPGALERSELMLRDALESTASIAYARTRAESLVGEAIAELDSLPASPARTLLHAMAAAVVNRSY